MLIIKLNDGTEVEITSFADSYDVPSCNNILTIQVPLSINIDQARKPFSKTNLSDFAIIQDGQSIGTYSGYNKILTMDSNVSATTKYLFVRITKES